MADDLETSLKNVAGQVASYVKDVATLTVETRVVRVDADAVTDFGQARAAARTIIKLDGDSETVLPLQAGEAGLTVDKAIFELHQQGVETAIAYRAKMLEALLGVFRGVTP